MFDPLPEDWQKVAEFQSSAVDVSVFLTVHVKSKLFGRGGCRDGGNLNIISIQGHISGQYHKFTLFLT